MLQSSPIRPISEKKNILLVKLKHLWGNLFRLAFHTPVLNKNLLLGQGKPNLLLFNPPTFFFFFFKVARVVEKWKKLQIFVQNRRAPETTTFFTKINPPRCASFFNLTRLFSLNYKGMFRQCGSDAVKMRPKPWPPDGSQRPHRFGSDVGDLVQPLAPALKAWFRSHLDRAAAAMWKHTLMSKNKSHAIYKMDNTNLYIFKHFQDHRQPLTAGLLDLWTILLDKQ